MVDVKKLDSAIESLEYEIDNIKNLSKIVTDIAILNEDVSANNKSSNDVIEELMIIKKELSDTIGTYERFIEDVKQGLERINNTLDSRVFEIQKDNIEFNKSLENSYKEIENDLLTKLQNIRSENKKMYLEFDDLLSSKLDKNKSDIQIEIRNNSKEIIEIIEVKINSRVVELENNIIKYYDEVSKKAENNKKLLLLLTVIAVINVFIVAYTSFVK